MSRSATLLRPSPATTGAPSPVRSAAGTVQRRLRVTDGLLAVAVALWAFGVAHIHIAAIGQDGLLPALPITYFLGIGLVVVSFAVALSYGEISKVRLAAHIGILIFMLQGTAPLIYAEPRYAYLYKHIGVVQYINLHGQLNRSIDIYQNWPGFFALAAWFDRLAGVSSPLSYAAWAQVFFDLLTTVELAFAFRALPMTKRERWLGLMLFTLGDWVGADYFSPQALGFVLSIGVMAIALNWLVWEGSPRPGVAGRAGRAVTRGFARVTPRWLGPVGTGTNEADPTLSLTPVARGATPRAQRVAPILALLGVYLVLVLTHQLSPYIVAAQLAALTVFGKLRVRWLVFAMVAIALAYLAPAFSSLNRTYGLISSLGNLVQNVRPPTTQPTLGLSSGVVLWTRISDLLVLGLGILALLGAWRRRREGRPVAIFVLLMLSPVVIVTFLSYGGEAILRVFLFSLPWVACLGASALRPKARPLRWSARPLILPAVLVAGVALLIPAVFTMDADNMVPAGEVAAANYFYTHAPTGSVLMTTGNFPTKLSGRYNLYADGPSDSDPSLLVDPALRAKMLGAPYLGQVSAVIRSYEHIAGAQGYMAISQSEETYATDYGLLPAGSLQHLAAAMRTSPDWRVVFQNTQATIFELVAPGNPS
jgi:hypothetical protein